ncbi:acetyl-CoA carboxylase carboxyltransferase subunit alpha [bacterium]|nr:acetyl-CoA carboxylase carboxyltransferase subunit alpha [candidate division CSSED10-310 bacterium]
MTTDLPFERPILELEAQIENLRQLDSETDGTLKANIRQLERRLQQITKRVYDRLSTWERVLVSRHPRRPHSLDYIREITTEFTEIHGDRAFRDDLAVVTGLARFDGIPVVVVAQQKGRDMQEKVKRNFGMMHPEGYRKALRAFRLAERFRMPVLVFVDTPGAYPGVGAEERGQAEAIARNVREMSLLRTSIIISVVGEGGSGGALGVGVGDVILIQEYAVYSVISPEGCAAILWRDNAKAPDAAEALKMTAPQLFERKLVDEIIKEPVGGAHRNPRQAIGILKRALRRHLHEMTALTIDEILDRRYAKYRPIGPISDTRLF